MKLIKLAPALLLVCVQLQLGCTGCSEKPKQVAAQGPIVSQVEPARGPTAGGTVILIKGERFSPEATVRINRVEATAVTVADGQTLTALTPANDADGAVDVEVQNPDGNAITFTGGYTYYKLGTDAAPAPAIAQVSPNQGPLLGGTLIELRGTNFQDHALVFIGGRPAHDVTFVSSELVTAIVPPGVGNGGVEVAVTNPDGQSLRLDGAFAYYTPTAPGPKLVGVVPSQGTVQGGDTVDLSGDGFASGLRVYFGGFPASGVTVVGQDLSAITPAGTPGLKDVSVVNPDGQTFTQPGAFNFYEEPPRISRVTPIEGPREGGTDLLIEGRNFDANTNVTVGGKPVTSLTIVDSQSATAKSPAGDVGGFVDVKVVSKTGLSDTAKGGFYYIDADHPSLGGSGASEKVGLVRVTPSTGPANGGTTVTILGSGFKPGAKVRFGSTDALDVQVLGATSISARTPAGPVGPATLTVENLDGKQAVLELAFTYYGGGSNAGAPQISGISPNTGPSTGNTKGLLTGANFKPGVHVYFGSTEAAQVTVVSSSQLTFVTPQVSATGPVNVTVVTDGGLSGQLVSGFVFYTLTPQQQANAPVVTSLNPASGPAGEETPTTITGDKFQTGAVVFFGADPGTSVNVENINGLSVTTPMGAVGAVDVTVTNPDGLSTTRNAGFTFLSPSPKLQSMTPAKGPLAGGLTALIVGSGFAQGAQVFFGTVASTDVQIVGTTVAHALIPPGQAGVVDVKLVNPDSQADTLAGAFEYDPAWQSGPAPTLSQILPNKGPSTGGSYLLLKGTDFLPNAQVYFGGTAAQKVFVNDPTEIVAVTPPGAEGAVHVSVVNPDGQASVIAGGFTYVNPATLGTPPTLNGVTPTAGPATATTNALVTGQNLKANAYLYFGGRLAKNPVLLSSNIYSAQAQPHAPGVVDIAITHPDGQSSVVANAFTYVAAPEVQGVLPQSGKTSGGTNVTVTGTGFQPGATITFGGKPATNVNVASGTLLTCTTPSGAAGPQDVTVKNPDNQSGTLTGGFTFIPPPSFDTTTALLPAQGPTTGGSIIEIHGDGFQNGATVTFRGQMAQVEYIDANTLVVVVPAAAVGTADVVITNPDGQSATLTGGFLYKTPSSLGPAPMLSGATPGKGSDAGGSRVQINGGAFVDGARVFFALHPGAGTGYVSPAELATTVPPHAVGKVILAVTNPDGQTATLTDGFEYVAASTLGAPPTLTLVTPQTASRFGGTLVTLTGTNIQSGAVAFFGGLPGTNTTTNGTTQAQTTTPAHKEGPAVVEITNPDGQTAVFPGAFAFIIPAPQLTGVVPSSGPTQGGTVVTVSGSDLHPNVVITFGTKTATCTWQSATQLSCTTPAGSNGPVQVTATNPDGQSASLAAGFTYAAPPTITQVNPTSGPQAGGTTVTITGSFFQSGATVSFGGTASPTVTFISPNALQAVTPAGVGPAAVKVTNPDGQFVTLAGGFTYLPPVPPPTISGLTPNYGVSSGGTNVTLAGSGFQAGAQVFFGTTAAATVQVFSPTYINVVAPAGAVGTVDVKITNPDNQSATKQAAYQYIAQGQLPPLAVDAVTPNRGPTAGNSVVTVTGRGFQVGAIVAIGGATCASPQYIGPGAITCTVAGHAAGQVSVVVTNPGGGSATLNNGYTYGDGGQYVIAAQRIPPESLTGKQSNWMFDIDGDGDQDILQTFDGYSWIEWNDGTGKFTLAAANALTPINSRGAQRFQLVAPPTDLNGDGTPDLMVRGRDYQPNYCCNYLDAVFVFKNVGGVFTEVQRFGDATYFNGPMIFVDVDNDGDKDMIWGRDTNELVFKNNGQGVFTLQATGFPNVSDNTRAVCAGDVDKDGDQDIFVANDFDQQKRLYLNNGQGVFTDVSSTNLNALGGNSYGCAMTDIDKDNDLDIIVINNGQQDRVYVNDGTGHFTDGTTGRLPTESDDSTGAQMVDVDFDGDLDLVSRVSAYPHERVYLSDGNGQFVPANPDLVPAAIGPDYTWSFADVDQDGYPDLLRSHEGGQNRILLNKPSGTPGKRKWVDATMTAYPSEWLTKRAAAFVDIDGDGDKDLIAADESTENTGCRYVPWYQSYCQVSWKYHGAIRIYLNDGAGNFIDATNTRMITNPDVKADTIAVANFDGVNGPDFAVNDRSDTGRVRLYLNNGAGYFTESSYPNIPAGSFYSGAVLPLDVDQDGRPDLVVGGDYGLRYWRNVGGAYFVDLTSTTMPTYPQGYSAWVSDISAGDLNLDGKVDLFLARPYGNAVVDWDPVQNKFVDVTTSKMPSASTGWRAYLFDADKDGDLDAIVANCTDDRIYLNTGTGYMADNTNTNLPRTSCTEDYAIVDPNGDGLPDLYVVKRSNGTPEQDQLLINNGGGIYQNVTPNRVSVDDDYGTCVVNADIDGDGRDDLFVCNSGQPRIYRGAP